MGSDLDLFVIVENGVENSSENSVERPGLRSVGWGQETLPVPAEVVVYTQDEWQRASDEKRRFYRTIEREAMWLWTHPAFRT